MSSLYYDLHCHLDWFANAVDVAHDADGCGLSVFANTVTPDGFERARDLLAGCGSVVVGVGAHPWWIADGRLGARDIARAAELALDARHVGEVGLDFSGAHVPPDSRDVQVSALRAILVACDAGVGTTGPKLLSLHAVRSASSVLDLLEETGCMRSCACIFHWFSGTSDELHRAVRGGCRFSINEMMLATRRGREYARQLPSDRLLTETDLPPKEGFALSVGDVVASLERTLARLHEIRGHDVAETICENAAALLGR